MLFHRNNDDSGTTGSVKHRIWIIVIVILAALCILGGYAYHSSKVHQENRIQEARQNRNSIKVEKKKGTSSGKMLNSVSRNNSDEHKSAKSKLMKSKKRLTMLNAYARKVTATFREAHVPVSVTFNNKNNRMIYNMQGQAAETWNSYYVANNKNDIKRTPQARKMLPRVKARINRDHDRIIKVVRHFQKPLNYSKKIPGANSVGYTIGTLK